MTYWLMIFVSGFLGSPHCLGMCGPFVVLLGSANPRKDNVRRQWVYSFGRLTTYVFLGAALGAFGARLSAWSPWGISFAAIFSITAGVMLVLLGLRQFGIGIPVVSRAGSASCLSGRILRTYLATPGWTGALLAGACTGFLPCGFVYSFLALAGQSGSPSQGAAVMLAFGLGTFPLMIAAGCSAGWLTPQRRQPLLKLAAIGMIVVGGMTIHRGARFMVPSTSENGPTCPGCASLP